MKQSVNDAVCNIKRLKYKLRSLNFKDINEKNLESTKTMKVNDNNKQYCNKHLWHIYWKYGRIINSLNYDVVKH